jgi:hypothetical protein
MQKEKTKKNTTRGNGTNASVDFFIDSLIELLLLQVELSEESTQ